MYLYIYIYIYIHIYISIYVCICIFIFISIHIYIYVYIYTITCIYVYMYTYIWVMDKVSTCSSVDGVESHIRISHFIYKNEFYIRVNHNLTELQCIQLTFQNLLKTSQGSLRVQAASLTCCLPIYHMYQRAVRICNEPGEGGKHGSHGARVLLSGKITDLQFALEG